MVFKPWQFDFILHVLDRGNFCGFLDTSVQQTVSFRCRVNKQFVFGGASTNGSFSEARQQTARFRWHLNKQVWSFFDIFKLISDL